VNVVASAVDDDQVRLQVGVTAFRPVLCVRLNFDWNGSTLRKFRVVTCKSTIRIHLIFVIFYAKQKSFLYAFSQFNRNFLFQILIQQKKEKFNISFSVYEFRFLAVVMAMGK
jgi:hypothetical protein